MTGRLALLSVIAACGRLHFADRVDASMTASDAADAAPLPADVVAVASTTFFMGCNLLSDAACEPAEMPGRMVTLTRSFAIERTEVTEAAYQDCIAGGGCTAPNMQFDPIGRAQHPVNYVTWIQADAYCAWRGRRLPTEAEWELAARGTDGRIYPWGNAPFSCAMANAMNCVADTLVVGSYPASASPYGALDMSGNLWEWVNDWYDPNYYNTAPMVDPPGPPSLDGSHVQRGGYYANAPGNLRASNRGLAFGPNIYAGFRCAISL